MIIFHVSIQEKSVFSAAPYDGRQRRKYVT